MQLNKLIILYFMLPFVSVLINGCKDNPAVSEIESGQKYDLCYHKIFNQNWEIYLNSVKGDLSKNITKWEREDSDNAWSPDGRYIAFSRLEENRTTDICIYDIQKDTIINLTAEPDLTDSYRPIWTPDGSKIIYSYQKILDKQCTYIMNIDGSGKKKLLEDEVSRVYFYDDGYNFLYTLTKTEDVWSKIYKSDLGGSKNEYIADCATILSTPCIVQDYFPAENKLLLYTLPKNNKRTIVCTYDLDNKAIDTLIQSVEGGILELPKYSSDYRSFSYVETTNNYELHKLIVYNVDKKTNKLITEISDSKSVFHFIPSEFSPSGRYLAFVRNEYGSGPNVSWTSYLYLADLVTGEILFIDEGANPVWNKKCAY